MAVSGAQEKCKYIFILLESKEKILSKTEYPYLHQKYPKNPSRCTVIEAFSIAPHQKREHPKTSGSG
ncbi:MULTISPECIES: hypothetical protein [unclassified Herbaspirillum]|uniref:hypothetical protein n=1 Tax=unclassified Herbaspirillum TaxID=2624150 RepID=UPI00114DDFE4|nr:MULTISPECIES: hypothetical protein [unclassified Herbaspirillum]MBB5390827.1 hypothetical protein [Herbaspirillum sp. SJZ102]